MNAKTLKLFEKSYVNLPCLHDISMLYNKIGTNFLYARLQTGRIMVW